MVSMAVVCINIPLVIALLIKIRCQIQKLAIVLIFCIVINHLSKAISDAIKVYDNKVRQQKHMTMYIIVTVFERIECFVLFIYVLSIQELKIKISATSYPQFKIEKEKQGVVTKYIVILFVCIQLPVIAIQVIRSIGRSPKLSLYLNYLDILLRGVFAILNIYMGSVLIRIVSYFR